MHEEAAPSPILDFQAIKLCGRRNLVRRPDCRMGLENAKAIVELDIERIFPADAANVFNGRILGRAKWDVGVQQTRTYTAFALSVPFGQITGRNLSLRFSARTLRATRPNARSARATNAGCLFAPFVFRLFFIGQSNAELNLHHRS